MTTSFADLGLPDALIDTLKRNGIVEPFPIQSSTIPDALDGTDVSGMAPTGSGKTLAFGLALITRVGRGARNKPRALILAPTRELAQQIKDELAPLARIMKREVAAIYGGVGYGPQKTALRNGVDILVATPGRLEDLLEQRTVDLGMTNIVVIDEADRMADMGFLPAVRRILDQTSDQRQTMLFSATLDGDIATLSREYQHRPVRHDAEHFGGKTGDVRHLFWLVDHHDRINHAAKVIESSGRTIVFTRTRHGADRLARQLTKLGVGAVPLHGGRSQNQRTRALKDFDRGRAAALVATDVAARGIHVDAVESVIHFDPTADSKDYLHRSGRTARAGAGGTVVSLVTPQQRATVSKMLKPLGMDTRLVAPHEIGVGGKSANSTPIRKAEQTRSRPKPNGPGEKRSLYVGNLAWKTEASSLGRFFGRYGHVHDATVVIDNRGRSKGYGFVEVSSGDIEGLIRSTRGSKLDGRDLAVRHARPSRKRS